MAFKKQMRQPSKKASVSLFLGKKKGDAKDSRWTLFHKGLK